MADQQVTIIGIFLLALFFLLYSGCISDQANGQNQANEIDNQANNVANTDTTNIPIDNGSNNINAADENLPPVVNLELDQTEGPSPFYITYTYTCYDPKNELEYCELKIDGQTYAKAPSQKELMPEGYKHPDFFGEAEKTQGTHELEIIAFNKKGLSASKKVTFTVLKPAALSEPGWYLCNNNEAPPCDLVTEYYCDKFTSMDLDVRNAASEAISKHPGKFSINQLLDIYDWVLKNVFYQNVPIELWPPYYPKETLKTKSGDCKNQAVLIASMVEAIGGNARILYIPECQHAFAEVYVGNDSERDAMYDAIWTHYKITQEQYQALHTHGSTNDKNERENWFIFDTAGGSIPGDTIKECLASTGIRTFEIRDCNSTGELQAPEVQGTAYGPEERQNETYTIEAGWSRNYSIPPWIQTAPEFKWCHYKVEVESLSTFPLTWYITDTTGLEKYNNNQSFQYLYGEANVQKGMHEFDWDKADTFVVIIKNDNSSAITTKTHVTETCYKD